MRLSRRAIRLAVQFYGATPSEADQLSGSPRVRGGQRPIFVSSIWKKLKKASQKRRPPTRKFRVYKNWKTSRRPTLGRGGLGSRTVQGWGARKGSDGTQRSDFACKTAYVASFSCCLALKNCTTNPLSVRRALKTSPGLRLLHFDQRQAASQAMIYALPSDASTNMAFSTCCHLKEFADELQFIRRSGVLVALPKVELPEV